MNNQYTIQITKTRQQVATELGICTKTLLRKLTNAGIILPSGLLTPKEQQIIYDVFNCNCNEVSQNVQ